MVASFQKLAKRPSFGVKFVTPRSYVESDLKFENYEKCRIKSRYLFSGACVVLVYALGQYVTGFGQCVKYKNQRQVVPFAIR